MEVTKHPSDPEMLKIDVEPITPKLLNKRQPTLPLLITLKKKLPKPTALENETPKPVVTLVYSRKPRKSKTNVPISKSKVLKFVSANKKEPSLSWGSIVFDVPSSPSLLNACLSQIVLRIIETIHVDFDELTAMASEHSSSGPALHDMTPTTISSGSVPNPPLQQLVDNPAPEVIAPITEVPTASTGSPSSTIVDQDAPSPSNDPYFGILILEVPSDQSSSTDSIHTIDLQFSNPRGIFINQSKYALESLKKYNFDSYDPVDTPMVEKSKLDEDKEGKAVDPLHYRDMIGTLLYLTPVEKPDL
ncbi:hypothetical protein Tco_0205308 [Tanacetum coccineum]